MIKKLKAFSLVELMMILLVASLIVAAVAPVVTKKHFKLPSLVNHGAYMCYYKDGQLREAKWAGKFQQQALFDRATENCVFTPPKKAAYFQISAIGGGGGGGDAGYRGGNWVSSPNSDNNLSPFEITTENLLKMMDLQDTPVAEIPELIEDWKQYAGYLIPYANSLGSGKGGNAGATKWTCNPPVCTKYGTKEEYHAYKEIEYGSGSVSSDGKCHYDCREWNATCEKTETPRPYKACDQLANECGGCAKVKTVECTGTHTEKYNCHETSVSCSASDCGGSGHLGVKGGADVAGGCNGYETTCSSGHQTCDTREVPNDTKEWCTECEEEYPLVYNEGSDTLYGVNCVGSWGAWGDPDCLITEPDENGKCPTVNPKTWGDYYTVSDALDCIGDKYVSCYSYHDYGYGGAGGNGAACQGSKIPGGLGRTRTSFATGGSPVSGANVNEENIETCFGSGNAGNGYAVCEGGTLAHECSSPSSSYYVIRYTNDSGEVISTSALAYGATKGGTGGSVTGTEDNNGKCQDVTADGVSGRDGTCGSFPDGTTPACTGPGDYGYCLLHYDGTVEPDGLYKMYYGYDQNYLGYGSPGNPGEFKTTIVRSLTDVDTTIKVGRGGSAAAIESGNNGMDGSSTSMGSIILAAGGSGGEGSQKEDSKTLPTYNKERRDKESLCFYYDKYTSTDETGAYRYNTPEAVQLRNTLNSSPEYCAGMVNNQDAYKFYKLSGNHTGAYPTPTGVFSTFMNIAFSNTGTSDVFNKFLKYGKGGTGGGVEHRCWAGRHDVVFEGNYLLSSVYVDSAHATAYALAHNRYVPDGCRDDYSNLPASPGADGALLIKW